MMRSWACISSIFSLSAACRPASLPRSSAGGGGAATRSTVDGIRDALAENYVLASCAELLPREVGSSTFHDVAAARAAFERGWDADRVSAFVEGTKDRHPIFGPAFCAALDGGDWGTKKSKKGA